MKCSVSRCSAEARFRVEFIVGAVDYCHRHADPFMGDRPRSKAVVLDVRRVA